jgi:hypothetical protein
MPLLASLAWNVFRMSEDEAFLSEIFPKVAKYFWAWFSPRNDRDHDGLPEWGSLFQTGYEDNPLFSLWHPWAQGADITSMRHPALLAMLYREARVLMQMAARLGRQEETLLVEKQAETLKSALQTLWEPRSALYHYCDRASGVSAPGKVLARQRGPGTIKLKQTFEPPVRLLIEVQGDPLESTCSMQAWHWPSFYNVVTGKTLALPNLIALQHIPLSPAGV